MEKLIVVRHGQYKSSDGQLSESGRNKIMALSQKIKHIINNTPVLLASPIRRAKESAEIIGEFFGVEQKNHEVLEDGYFYKKTYSKDILSFLESYRGESVVIIVTHYNQVMDIPAFFAEKEFGVKLDSYKIDKGEAWIIDCELKSLTHICP